MPIRRCKCGILCQNKNELIFADMHLLPALRQPLQLTASSVHPLELGFPFLPPLWYVSYTSQTDMKIKLTLSVVQVIGCELGEHTARLCGCINGPSPDHHLFLRPPDPSEEQVCNRPHGLG